MPHVPHTSRPLAIKVFAAVAFCVLVGVLLSVTVAVWMLAAICLAGAVSRVIEPEAEAFVVRRRLVDVSILLIFAGSFGYLAAVAALD